MTLTRIKPVRPQLVKTPQCCGRFDPSSFQKHYLERRQELGYDWQRCTRPSSYKIGGLYYCTQHAARLALEELTRRDGDR